MNENEQKAGSVADQKSKIRERYKGINPDELDVIPALPQEDIFAVENEQRVAVYARVSTDDPRQTSSYELQKNHYHDVISKSPNWKLVQIYADEGISGTSLQHRDQFKLMIEDCKKGQIDLIVTKSVSRFARNVVDCIGYVRELLALPHPVGVFFETERLNTFDSGIASPDITVPQDCKWAIVLQLDLHIGTKASAFYFPKRLHAFCFEILIHLLCKVRRTRLDKAWAVSFLAIRI